VTPALPAVYFSLLCRTSCLLWVLYSYFFTSICQSVWLSNVWLRNLAAKVVILFNSEYSLSCNWNGLIPHWSSPSTCSF
jgi:hypothetical protein